MGLVPGSRPEIRRRFASQRLREKLQRPCPVPVRIPPLEFCTDNAAMIGGVAGHHRALGERSPIDEDIFATNRWSRLTEQSLVTAES